MKLQTKSAADNTLDAGAKAIAGGLGGVAGFAVAGPFGGLLGSFLGNALPAMFEEVASRQLGRRERERVGAVYIFAETRLKELKEHGETLRDDEFFNETPQEGRRGVEEIVEAILVGGQREHEELKIPYYGNLFAAIAVTPAIDRPYANRLIRLAQELSLRQLNVLSIAANDQERQGLRQTDYRSSTSDLNGQQIALLGEIADIYHKGLINFSGEVLLGLSDVKPGAMKLQGDGTVLYHAMGLANINQGRKNEVKDLLV